MSTMAGATRRLAPMQEVAVVAAPLHQLETLLAPGRWGPLSAAAERSRRLLDGRVVWNVNATAHGGGVAEMLQALLAYGRGAGVDTRWLVLEADPEFFAITKRIHNALHGVGPLGTGLGVVEHEHYQRVLAANLASLQTRVRPGDIVLLHDPQTAGLVDGVRAAGARVIWRSHIGRDQSNAQTDEGWAFLRGYLERADAFVFSRRAYVPDWVPPTLVRVIEPSIDPFSTKNYELDDGLVRRVLARAGLVGTGAGDPPISFVRRGGASGTVRGHADLLGGADPPPVEAPLVLQVSRWDRLKDMSGVLSAFAEHVAPVRPDVHLMLAGPDVSGVGDDPEGREVLEDCRLRWARLPASIRRRCQLASIPMDDTDENAVVVNALQRHAAVVVQKSLAEGFGLTVSEALWKSKPVLASGVGGIQDQIVDGREGLLLSEPGDLRAFASRLLTLLDDRAFGARLGENGHERVRAEFLGDRHLVQYLNLFEDLLAGSRPVAGAPRRIQ